VATAVSGGFRLESSIALAHLLVSGNQNRRCEFVSEE
jgi:hypothetical protein